MNSIRSALIVNTNHPLDILTTREFVWPLQRALPVPSQVIPLSKFNARIAESADMIVLSGCTLKDNAYLKAIPKLAWLKSTHKPILGICAGQHLLAAAHGAKIKSLKTAAIGVHPVRITHAHPLVSEMPAQFNSYFLHGNEPTLPNGFISLAKSAFSPNEIIVHKTKPHVGISFHPEVLNRALFTSFFNWAEKH